MGAAAAGGTIPAGGASSRVMHGSSSLHVVSGAPRVTRHPPGWAGWLSSEAQRPSATTGLSHWNRTTTAAVATGHRPRDRCAQARTGAAHPDERSKGHALNGETEEAGREANDWEKEQVGEEDTGRQIERKDGGRRRWGRFTLQNLDHLVDNTRLVEFRTRDGTQIGPFPTSRSTGEEPRSPLQPSGC